MTGSEADARSRRFAQTAIPLLDDVYRLARFFLRDPIDAEDAVQECYLRALRHFDSYRGPAMKPWLFSILRNICYTKFSQSSRREAPADFAQIENLGFDPLWQETQPTPEADMLCHQESDTVRKIIASLPRQFREVIVMREIDGLSYRDIADVTGAALGTVMSRLARARAMLRTELSVAGLAPQRVTEEITLRVAETAGTKERMLAGASTAKSCR